MAPIALATCATLPAEADESALEAALAAVAIPYRWTVWSDGAVDWSRYAAVLIRTTWDYHGRLAEFLAWSERVASTTPLWNPAAVVRWNAHKGYLRDLDAAGVPIVPTAVIPVGAPVGPTLAAEAAGWDDIVVKPAVGAGALGAARFPRRGDDAADHVRELHDGGRDAVVQPFMDSVARPGELSVIVVDGEVTHAVRKVPAAGDFRSQPEWGGRLSAVEAGAAHRAVALRAWAAAERRTATRLLYARVDMIDGLDGPRVIELEVIEPDLFLGFDDAAAGRLVTALAARIGSRAGW